MEQYYKSFINNIISSITNSLEMEFNNKVDVIDFLELGKEIGVADIYGFMISGDFFLKEINLNLFYFINITEEIVEIGFTISAPSLSCEELEHIEKFNKKGLYKHYILINS